MKYRIKKARGTIRVCRSMNGGIWVYTIMAQGTAFPCITYRPVTAFAEMYRIRRAKCVILWYISVQEK